MAVKKIEKKPTEYVVLRSDTATGPFTVVGNHTTHGQIAAKKAAALLDSTTGQDPEKSFFVAVPASSFWPQKPVVQMTITFLTDEGKDAGDEEDASEDEGTDGEGEGTDGEGEDDLVPEEDDEADLDAIFGSKSP
jgi:hypothetical protein